MLFGGVPRIGRMGGAIRVVFSRRLRQVRRAPPLGFAATDTEFARFGVGRHWGMLQRVGFYES